MPMTTALLDRLAIAELIDNWAMWRDTGRWDDFRTGVLTNVLNPKVALFFLAFLPQFVPAGAPDKTLSFLLLGAWFVVQSLLFLLALVAIASQFARWQASASIRRLLGALGGVLFIGLALRLLRARPLGA